jgi:hypothetical protein
MVGDASAYAVLGVDPGSDSAEIEHAYRRLIKQHHPDREGGDAGRAADINRAYRELRTVRDLKDPLEFNFDLPAPRPAVPRWLLLALLLLLVAGALLWSQTDLFVVPAEPGPVLASSHRGNGHSRSQAADDAMEKPLNTAAINSAALEALRISRTRDEMTLASTSRDCHHLLRGTPSVLQLDRCAAFDDAVVQLQDRDPLRDQGPFSELAVTGRLWSGASALSDDSVAIDGRLDRIRLQVELALAATYDAPVLHKKA